MSRLRKWLNTEDIDGFTIVDDLKTYGWAALIITGVVVVVAGFLWLGMHA